MDKVKIFSKIRSADTLEVLINDYLTDNNCVLKSVDFTHVVDDRPYYEEPRDYFSAVMIYEQLEGNTPESTNENIINMHKEFLKYEINEIQEQLEGQYIKSIDIDFLNGAKAGLEKSLKHLEQIGG